MADGMERRDFLKVLGVAGAGASLFGCSTSAPERLIPYVVAPEDIVPGIATWYRTTCRECPAGCGMDIRTREGRAVKAEGNPLSPISQGRLCARGQASLHGLYNPDRVPQALARAAGGGWDPVNWDDAEQQLASVLQQAPGNAVFLTQDFAGSLDRLIDEWCAAFGVQRVRFDTFAWEPIRAANRLLFGYDGVPTHDFANAEVVVSFGADFMETWISPVSYTHGFTRAHAYAEGLGRRGRFIAVTPHQTLTDMNADTWLAIRPGTEHLVALAMARSVVDQGRGEAGDAAQFLTGVDVPSAAEAAGIPEEQIHQAAREFANGGRSVAVGPGVASTHRAATSVAAAVAVLNYVAGNIGTTVRFGQQENAARGGTYRDMQDLLARMRQGEVGALLVYGPNPLYSIPTPEDTDAALRQVPFIASFSPYLDETSSRAHLLLPDHHFLESWGDYVPRTGVHSLIQPVMTPVFSTKQTGDVLISVARRAGRPLPSAATTFYDYLREAWARDIFTQPGATMAVSPGAAGPAIGPDAAFEDWWRAALQSGVVNVPVEEPQLALGAAGLGQLRYDVPEFLGEADAEYYLVVYPSLRFYDGRLANRPWLQELPDPISKVSWTSWVEVNPDTAAELGLVDGNLVDVATPYGEARLPVWIHPGTRPDVIAVQLGQGHEELGRYAQNRGVNATRLIGTAIDEPSGGLAWFQTRAALRPTGLWERQPSTGRLTDEGRHIARTASLASAREADGLAVAAVAAPAPQEPGAHPEVQPTEAVVDQLQGVGGFGPVHNMGAAPADYPPPGTLYGEYSPEVPRWGMAIDLERCTGCSACITACYAENNIGIVGPDQVQRGRLMTWLRVERYYPDTEHGEEGAVRFLPMLCQQCGTAPCEPVCPVYAAYHTPDGLNAQVYNRCVGTRYCANNCPYKVRYFNWFTWEWPEPMNWQLNPDVTVREKGVMEKCTFCVQRIRGTERQAVLEGRPVRDGEIVPACAQTCPGEAIVFGNMKDPNSRVAQLAASGRGYRVLEELNTQSAIVYLKQVVLESSEA